MFFAATPLIIRFGAFQEPMLKQLLSSNRHAMTTAVGQLPSGFARLAVLKTQLRAPGGSVKDVFANVSSAQVLIFYKLQAGGACVTIRGGYACTRLLGS